MILSLKRPSPQGMAPMGNKIEITKSELEALKEAKFYFEKCTDGAEGEVEKMFNRIVRKIKQIEKRLMAKGQK